MNLKEILANTIEIQYVSSDRLGYSFLSFFRKSITNTADYFYLLSGIGYSFRSSQQSMDQIYNTFRSFNKSEQAEAVAAIIPLIEAEIDNFKQDKYLALYQCSIKEDRAKITTALENNHIEVLSRLSFREHRRKPLTVEKISIENNGYLIKFKDKTPMFYTSELCYQNNDLADNYELSQYDLFLDRKV